MNAAFHLYRQQKIDTQIQQLKSRVSDQETRLASDPALVQAEQNLRLANQKLQEARQRLSKAEDEVKNTRIKMELDESSLYGGRIHNPKELQDLQNEVAALKRLLSQKEDDQLNCMVALEDAENIEKQSQAYLEKTKASSLSSHAALAGELGQSKRAIEKLHEERLAVANQIPHEAQEIYERLRATKKGLAVSLIDDDTCSICGTSIRPEEIQAARSSSHLVFCAFCGRILYAS